VNTCSTKASQLVEELCARIWNQPTPLLPSLRGFESVELPLIRPLFPKLPFHCSCSISACKSRHCNGHHFVGDGPLRSALQRNAASFAQRGSSHSLGYPKYIVRYVRMPLLIFYIFTRTTGTNSSAVMSSPDVASRMAADRRIRSHSFSWERHAETLLKCCADLIRPISALKEESGIAQGSRRPSF
jgi:hypothetical protein